MQEETSVYHSESAFSNLRFLITLQIKALFRLIRLLTFVSFYFCDELFIIINELSLP